MSQSVSLDPRVNAFRPDIADLALRDVISAERYVEPVLRQCVRGIVPLFASPDPVAPLVSQIRYGEFVDVFEMRADGFAWVQNRMDRYVGYMPAADVFSEEIADLSHRVCVLSSFIYPEPNIKVQPIDELTFWSAVHVGGIENGFRKLTNGGYVFAKHIAPANDLSTPDYVFTAGRLLNVPYLWGGRTPHGIDCSGLIQLALEVSGIDAPRDSDQQCQSFGTSFSGHWRDRTWRRGELVFFPGHVGVMTGPDQLLHASAFDMKVVVEPLLDVVARGNRILAVGVP